VFFVFFVVQSSDLAAQALSPPSSLDSSTIARATMTRTASGVLST